MNDEESARFLIEQVVNKLNATADAAASRIEQIANAISTICLCTILATIVMFVKACG